MKGAILYISFSRSSFSDVSELYQQQINTLLYKRELAEHFEVTYLLNNNLKLNEEYGKLRLLSENKSPLAFIMHCIKFVRKNAFEYVIVHSIDNFLQAAIIGLFSKAKVVMQHHAETTYRRKKAILMPAADKFIQGYFFNGKLVAQHFWEKKCISKYKVFEVAEGTTSFEPALVNDINIIKQVVFIGRLNQNKNLLTILNALSILKSIRTDFKLSIFYATNEQEKELKDFASKNELDEIVEFKGSVPNPEIEKILQQADIFISASFYEGSGYALIESLACGAFPVVSGIPSFNFLLDGLKEKELFDPNDENDLVLCMQRALNQEFTSDLKKRIREHFEKKTSPKAISRQIKEALLSLH